MLLKSFYAENLKVQICDTRVSMGEIVANEFAEYLKELLTKKEYVNIIFAAAPSQLDFLNSLQKQTGIDWSRVNAFHMDEYVGISEKDDQSFAGFVRREVVKKLGVKNFYPIHGNANNIISECERYEKILKKYKTDIVCLGIGENGHIAFNDPSEADFWIKNRVRIVNLEDRCRQQQVNDGCFLSIDDVPSKAFTLTIPALMSADAMFCTVPGKLKAEAVKNAVLGKINEDCPSSILRLHKKAFLYCDADSGKYLL